MGRGGQESKAGGEGMAMTVEMDITASVLGLTVADYYFYV